MKRHRLVAVIAVLASLALATNVVARPSLPEGGMGNKRSATPNVAGFDRQHGPHYAFECTALNGGANTNLDCDDSFPNNEPDVEVNPENPLHITVSSNDYGSCCDQYYTTIDGAASWSTGNMSIEKPSKLGSDPVTVFDRKHGVTIHASLSYSFQHAAGSQGCDVDVLVSSSPDGGLSWLKPVVVDDGIGCDLSKRQLFNDKEWIVTDNNPESPHYGRTYLTWTKITSRDGAYQESPIFESHSDNGGFSWSDPQEISGSNAAVCSFQVDGPSAECDQDQGSIPTVAPDGTVHVAFANGQNASLSEGEEADSQYLLVTSIDGGRSWSSPRFVVGLEDGERDYPLNVNGRQTLTGYQVRVWSLGNIVASPVDGTLYLVFSDNRNGVHDSDNPVTNSDVFLMVSTNSGESWSGPSQVDAGQGDQWFPWVDVDPTNGTIGILYHDRGASNRALYTTALAEGTPGSLVKTTVSSAPSNPTNSLAFRAGVEGCEACATFHGDYIGLSYGSDGVANAAWTDMSTFSTELDGFLQFIFFARK